MIEAKGDAALFVEAIGAPWGSEKPVLLFPFTGSSFETDTYDDIQRTYWSFHERGAQFNWNSGRLTTVRLYIQTVEEEPEFATFPPGASIFPELGEWPTRQEVVAALGTPDFDRGEYLCWWAAQDCIVRFDFDPEDRLGELTFMTGDLYR